jgi:Domain of unknown function (DUF3859)
LAATAGGSTGKPVRPETLASVGNKGTMMRAMLLAAMLLTAVSSARAEDVRIERVDVVDRGIYTVTVEARTPDPNAPAGTIAAPGAVKLLEATTTIPGRLGLEFGLQYVVVGEPAGDDVSLDFVLTYPAPGLVDPTDPQPILNTRFSRVKKIGDTVYLGYGFENDWEIVPGTWTFAITFGGRKLVEQSFAVTK